MPKLGRSFWRNEPPSFEQHGDRLVLRTGAETDFWNNTFYGFRHDNGHFLATEVSGDFSAETTMMPVGRWVSRTAESVVLTD